MTENDKIPVMLPNVMVLILNRFRFNIGAFDFRSTAINKAKQMTITKYPVVMRFDDHPWLAPSFNTYINETSAGASNIAPRKSNDSCFLLFSSLGNNKIPSAVPINPIGMLTKKMARQ